MKNYILSCCSTADLSKEHLLKRDIHYVCFHYELNGQEYLDDFGETIHYPDFYEAMRQGAETRTSQVNATEFELYFESFLKQGLDILHVCVSSGLSGTYNSANIAKEALLSKYPDRRILLVDSLGASSGYGLFMDKLADLRDGGMDIEALHAWANEHRLELHHWFFSTALSFYVKGGRISKTSGFVGNILNICPLLNVDAEGKLVPRHKIRGKKKAIEAIVSQMEQYASEGFDYHQKCFISHSDCYEDAKAVAALIEKRFPLLEGNVVIHHIGTTIGSHSGPGTVALFFWGDKRN